MCVQGSPTKIFFPTSVLMLKQVKIRTDKLLARKKDFLQFVTQKPLSKFKELIVTSPTLLRGQYTMSMTKTASDGLKAREWSELSYTSHHRFPTCQSGTKFKMKFPRCGTWKSRLRLKKILC